MRQGVLVPNNVTGRMDVRFSPEEYYRGLHCGDTMEYDMSGKVIILFATSGGSGFGHTVEHLEDSCNASALMCGKVLNGSDLDADIREWING